MHEANNHNRVTWSHAHAVVVIGRQRYHLPDRIATRHPGKPLGVTDLKRKSFIVCM